MSGFLDIVLIVVFLLCLSVFLYAAYYFTIRGSRMLALSPSSNILQGVHSVFPEDILISASQAEGFISELEKWISREGPDYIVGVNIGGWLLAAEVGRRAGLSRTRLAFAEIPKSSLSAVSITTGDGETLSGKICVLDDVTRKGTTLRLLSNYIFDQFQSGNNDVRKTSFAVMVTVRTREKSEMGYFNPDFSCHSVSNENVCLPWSQLSKVVREVAYSNEETGVVSGNDIGLNVRDFYDAMIRDVAIAQRTLRWSLTDPRVFDSAIVDRNFSELRSEEPPLLVKQA